MRTWIIGSAEDCDIVVARPRVSRRHCRFTERTDGYLIEDLGSSNGTYVNGERIAAATAVSAGDAITLGALEPLPWPPASGAPGASVLRIGRIADNEIVLDDARVSSHHARLLVSASRTLIEDAGSSNGTFLNAPDRRVTEAVALSEADTVYFGSFAVPASRLLAARAAPGPSAPILPPIPRESPTPASAVPAPQPAPMAPWTMLLLAQAPAIAVLILLLIGRQAAAPITATNWPAMAGTIASTMFALAIAAVWLGGSLAAWAALVGRPSPARRDSPEARLLGPPARRFAILGGLCVISCVVLLAIVHRGSGLQGPWLPMAGVLILASAVGLALGILVFSMVRDPAAAVGALALAFAAMIAMGGRIWPLPDSGAVAAIAAAMPSRWAFEGLLLLESGRQAAPAVPEGSDRVGDLAEGFFPAASARMGPKADVMALGFMLVGLSAAGLISSLPRPSR